MSSRVVPAWLLPVAWPLSRLYGAGVWLRNRAYDRGRGVDRLGTPVVSVGNLTVGGSGKTPVVAAVASALEALGAAVGILSRGYGRREREPFVLVSDGRDVLASVAEAGDEPLELALALPGVAVAVGADRYLAGKKLLEAVGPRVLLLDDGFQHRRLHRDLDLVCVDAAEPLPGLRLLPAGRLREPLASLGRAHVLVWTGSERARPGEALAAKLASAVPGMLELHAPIRVVGFAPLGSSASEGPAAANAFVNVPVGILAGVARPERLRADASWRVVAERFAPDHHWWRPDEVRAFAEEARAAGAEAILTTGKDAVKLAPLRVSGALRPALPMYTVRIAAEIEEGGALRELLERLPRL